MRMLSRVLKTSLLPALPAATSWRTAVKAWPMLLNDQLGDCVIAGIFHAAQLMTALASNEFIASNADALAAYEAIAGYDPADPSTDRGCVMHDAMQYLVDTGLKGQKLDAFASVDVRDLDNLRQVVHLFGAAPIGVELPRSAKGQFEMKEPWDTTFFPSPIEGGHCVDVVDYDEQFFYLSTWGTVHPATPRWMAKYCNQGYAPLSKLWTPANQAPSGFDYDQLLADLKALPAS